MYKIAMGNNLGNSASDLLEDQHEINYYQGKVSSVIEKDPFISIAGWRVINGNDYLNKQYYDWFWSHDSDIELSQNEIMGEKIKCLKEVDSEVYKEFFKNLEELKIKYKNMFDTLEELYKEADEAEGNIKYINRENMNDFNNYPILKHTIPLKKNEQIDIGGLQSRKELGILASEWFGRLEKFCECRFCTSVIKIDSIKIEDMTPRNENSIKPENLSKNYYISFLIDGKASALQKLLKLDYFQYLRNRKSGSLEMYSDKELQLLEEIYEWNHNRETNDAILSQLNGSNKGIKVAENNLDWGAILSGIPSKYIIGIKSNDIDSDEVAFLAGKLFNVSVINNKNQLIRIRNDNS